jgi:hypothetical protein
MARGVAQFDGACGMFAKLNGIGKISQVIRVSISGEQYRTQLLKIDIGNSDGIFDAGFDMLDLVVNGALICCVAVDFGSPWR